MKLKQKISKEEFDELNDGIKELYEENNGSYVLPLEEDDSLKTALQRERDEHKQTKAKNDEKVEELQRQMEEIKSQYESKQQEKAKENGDFESLLKSSEQKRQEIEQKYNQLTDQIAQEKLEHEASKIANKLGNTPENAELLSFFVKQRLKYTDEGLKVTDEQGNATISTVDELEKEFTESNRYASLVKGSQASGGGASGSGSGGTKTFNDYSEAELTQIANTNPSKFQEILKTKQK